MLRLNDLRIDRKIKEYFLRARFYTELDKNVGLVHDLEELDSNGELVLIRNRYGINQRIFKKYKTMLGDNRVKNKYYQNTSVIEIKDYELVKAFENVSVDKAVS
jgi:hypothetical protein